MKIIFVGDCHLSRTLPWSKKTDTSSDRLEDFKRFVESINWDEYETIVLMGDVFDKPKPDAASISAFLHFLNRVNRRVYLVPGNHECISWRRKDYAPKIFHLWENVTVVTEPSSYLMRDGKTVLHFFPWMPEAALKTVLEEYTLEGLAEDKHIAVVHQTISGVSLNGMKLSSELLPSDFEGFDGVVSGHIHQQSDIEARSTHPWIHYTGSVVPVSFADPNGNTLSILDLKTLEWELIPNKAAPTFLKVKANDKEVFDEAFFESLGKKVDCDNPCYLDLMIQVSEDVEASVLLEKLESALDKEKSRHSNFRDYRVRFDIKESKEVSKEEATYEGTNKDLLAEYLSTVPEATVGCDSEYLLQIGEKILELGRSPADVLDFV